MDTSGRIEQLESRIAEINSIIDALKDEDNQVDAIRQQRPEIISELERNITEEINRCNDEISKNDSKTRELENEINEIEENINHFEASYKDNPYMASTVKETIIAGFRNEIASRRETIVSNNKANDDLNQQIEDLNAKQKEQLSNNIKLELDKLTDEKKDVEEVLTDMKEVEARFQKLVSPTVPVKEPVVSEEELQNQEDFTKAILGLSSIGEIKYADELEQRKLYKAVLDNFLSFDYDSLSKEDKKSYCVALNKLGIKTTDQLFNELVPAEDVKDYKEPVKDAKFFVVDNLVSSITDEGNLDPDLPRETYANWYEYNDQKIADLEKNKDAIPVPIVSENEEEKENDEEMGFWTVVEWGAFKVHKIVHFKNPHQKVLEMAKDPEYIEEFKKWKKKAAVILAAIGVGAIAAGVMINNAAKKEAKANQGDNDLGKLGNAIIEQKENFEDAYSELKLPDDQEEKDYSHSDGGNTGGGYNGGGNSGGGNTTTEEPTPTPDPGTNPTPVIGETVIIDPGQTMVYPGGEQVSNPVDSETPIEVQAPAERNPEEAAGIEEKSADFGAELDAMNAAAEASKQADLNETSHQEAPVEIPVVAPVETPVEAEAELTR